MPTEYDEMGTLYIEDYMTGELKEVGDIVEFSIEGGDDANDADEILDDFFCNETITIPIKLTRKDERFWLRKVFEVPKYQVTETLFPRKKKRGTMRRSRRSRNEGETK